MSGGDDCSQGYVTVHTLFVLVQRGLVLASPHQGARSKVSNEESLYAKRFSYYFLSNLVRKAFKQP